MWLPFNLRECTLLIPVAFNNAIGNFARRGASVLFLPSSNQIVAVEECIKRRRSIPVHSARKLNPTIGLLFPLQRRGSSISSKSAVRWLCAPFQGAGRRRSGATTDRPPTALSSFYGFFPEQIYSHLLRI